jgi:hypothetical protein
VENKQISDKNDIMNILMLTKEKVYQPVRLYWLASIFFQWKFSVNAFSVNSLAKTAKS